MSVTSPELGAEHELDEKRQKRAEARAKRREEMQKALAEQQEMEGGEPEGGVE